MITKEQIENRIRELRLELEKYLVAANTQITAYQAAIGELERLLTAEVIDET